MILEKVSQSYRYHMNSLDIRRKILIPALGRGVAKKFVRLFENNKNAI